MVNPETFLNSLVDYEKTPGYDYRPEDFVAFLEKLGSPHTKLKNVIHIAGTKGKGATAAIISSVLQSAGYRTGLFTSPHLRCINERIKVANRKITNSELTYYVGKVKPYIRGRHQARTFFEALTAIAFLHFIRRKVAFTVLETGLGGRLDTTNTTTPLVSVITRIGYDHTQLLGTTLGAIAREKAGIIKKGVPVITVQQRPAVKQVLRRTARAQKTNLVYADNLHRIDVMTYSLAGSRVRIRGELGAFNAFLPLAGEQHIENLLLALGALSMLRQQGFHIPTPAITKGIRNTKLRGRFDAISSKRPLIIFDCAHNRDSFQALEHNLQRFKIRNFLLIFGCSKGKDIQYCLKNIFPQARTVFLVKADHPRARDPLDICMIAKKFQRNVVIAPSVRTVLEYARNVPQKKTTVVITGSFYLWQKNWVV